MRSSCSLFPMTPPHSNAPPPLSPPSPGVTWLGTRRAVSPGWPHPMVAPSPRSLATLAAGPTPSPRTRWPIMSGTRGDGATTGTCRMMRTWWPLEVRGPQGAPGWVGPDATLCATCRWHWVLVERWHWVGRCHQGWESLWLDVTIGGCEMHGCHQAGVLPSVGATVSATHSTVPIADGKWT